MSRQRFIYPEMFTSADFMGLSHGARLLWIGMFTTADDYGRGRADPASLKAAIFPGDSHTQEALTTWIQEVKLREMVVLYAVGGRLYYEIPTWTKYQNPKYKAVPKVPPPQRVARVRDKPGPGPGQTRTGPGDVVGCSGVGLGVEGSETTKSKECAQKPGASQPAYVAFKDWAFTQWQNCGGSGEWEKRDWVLLNKAYCGLVRQHGEEPADSKARASWVAFLGDSGEFYAGHYPRKWATEPSRWPMKQNPGKHVEHRREAAIGRH